MFYIFGFIENKFLFAKSFEVKNRLGFKYFDRIFDFTDLDSDSDYYYRIYEVWVQIGFGQFWIRSILDSDSIHLVHRLWTSPRGNITTQSSTITCLISPLIKIVDTSMAGRIATQSRPLNRVPPSFINTRKTS